MRSIGSEPSQRTRHQPILGSFFLHLFLAVAWVVLQSAQAAAQESQVVTDVRDDEHIVIFSTTAYKSTGSWIVPIHGWIYRPAQSRSRRFLIEQGLARGYGLQVGPESRSRFEDRVTLLLAKGLSGRSIVLRIGTRVLPSLRSGPDGHFATSVNLLGEEVNAAAPSSSVSIEAVLPQADKRSFKGKAVLVGEDGISVISDIDDTVKVTHVTNRREMFNHTFLQNFEPVAGMAELYRTWEKRGAVFHYLSSSPWQLYEPLGEFFVRRGFPAGAVHLKTASLTDATIVNFFESPDKTKPPEIETLLQRYPKHQFILVGDSGEKDPEVYAKILREHSGRIEKIYIRNVGGGTAGDLRFHKAFEGIDPKRWQVFSAPSEIDVALQ